MSLVGRPDGAGDGAWGEVVEIEPGGSAELLLTFRRGEGGYGGKLVALRLEGNGSLDKIETVVATEDGTASVWYTAPDPGPVDAVVKARYFEDSVWYEDSVQIRQAVECPEPTSPAALVDETTRMTDMSNGQSSAAYGTLSGEASVSPGDTDDLKRRAVEVGFDDWIYIIPECSASITFHHRRQLHFTSDGRSPTPR